MILTELALFLFCRSHSTATCYLQESCLHHPLPLGRHHWHQNQKAKESHLHHPLPLGRRHHHQNQKAKEHCLHHPLLLSFHQRPRVAREEVEEEEEEGEEGGGEEDEGKRGIGGGMVYFKL